MDQRAPPSFSTSTSLLRRLRGEDDSGWDRFAELYTPMVYRWAREAGLQPADVADVVQEVFQTVANRIGTFRIDDPSSRFRNWLWGITRNILRRHFRSMVRQPHAMGGSSAQQRFVELPEILESVDAPCGLDSEKNLVHRAIALVRNDFEEQTWQAFWRSTVFRQSTSEIAAELGMKSNAVRQAKYRVLSRIREELGD